MLSGDTKKLTGTPSSARAENIHIPEILAPAGGREQFFAALNSGADAVYLGLQSFNARARAENFSTEDLKELVPVAQAFGMKVLVTVNILVKQAELPDLFRTLAAIEEARADAIIVQDPMLAALCSRHFPELRLHASTQMAIHNAAGVAQATALGFRRVVLAREMTAVELMRIRRAFPREQVELEAFCHGSLCYSYSGLCFFSGAGDARSGNRGECAYTCRKPYQVTSEAGQGFLFSMKDLDTSADLDKFINAGIDTLKIEGRKKDAQYVATTVALYRKSLDRMAGRSTLRDSAPPLAHRIAEGDLDVLIRDREFSYKRAPTSFFLKGRYFENVIDLSHPTHHGRMVGKVLKVTPKGFIMTTGENLERFDGLRILPPGRVHHATPQHSGHVVPGDHLMVNLYENRYTEFSLRQMAVNAKTVTTAAAGATVEVAAPDVAGKISAGDEVFKVRSSSLKSAVAQLTDKPADTRLRAFIPVDLIFTLTADGSRLTVTAEVHRGDRQILTRSMELDAQIPGNKVSPGSAELDIRDMFSVFGDAGFFAGTISVHGDTGFFVPRSQLKALKKSIADELLSSWGKLQETRIQHAISAELGHPTALNAITDNAASFIVKTDCESVLRAARSMAAKGGLPIAEYIFEPRRNWLTGKTRADLQAASKALVAEFPDLRISVPMVVREWDMPLLNIWLSAAWAGGIRKFETGNIGGTELLHSAGIAVDTCDISSDFSCYALNSLSTRFWLGQGMSSVCLSVEDDAANLENHLSHLNHEERSKIRAILYKDTPLFVAEACSLTALHNGCPTAKVCGYRELSIRNMEGESFKVAHDSCKSIVYGDQAYSISQHQTRLMRAGVGNFRVDFMTRNYTADEIGNILAAIARGEPVPGTHPANFERELR